MGRPFQGDLRAALLAEAARQLADTPAAALSLRDVARHVGVSHVAAYRHFVDRDALLTAIARIDFQALRDAVRGAIGERQTAARAALERAGIAYVGFALARPHRFRSMFTQLGQGDATLKRTAEELFALLTGLVPTIGLARERHAVTLMAAAHGLACLALDNALPEVARDPPEMARAVAALVATPKAKKSTK